VYHRKLERRELFRDDRDREHFLELLAEVHVRFRIRIHAYALMSNQWYGVAETPDANLSEPWSSLCERWGDTARPLAMWAARRYCGFTLRKTGVHLGGMDYAAVGMALRRFEAKAGLSRAPPSTPPPDGGERIVELCFDDPFPDYNTEPVMAYANDPDFAA